MKYLLLFTIPLWLWGSKILSYNIYDRNDRVDVMLTFDTPYEGVLRQNKQNGTVIIKLEEALIESPKSKTVNSKFLTQISIMSKEAGTEIVAKTPENVIMQASKTSDSYGLRLRFISASGQNNPSVIPQPVDETELNSLPTKSDNEFEQSYYVVIAILIIGIGILLWLKNNIAKNTDNLRKEPKTPWLFNKPSVDESHKESAPVYKTPSDTGGVHIRFQKTLNPTHSVAMLDYGNMSYLVLLGNNTLLLEKFQDNTPITQSDFESLLQSKHRELDGFFQIPPTLQDEMFDAYKEKASGNY